MDTALKLGFVCEPRIDVRPCKKSASRQCRSEKTAHLNGCISWLIPWQVFAGAEQNHQHQVDRWKGEATK
jgi:hypothetical protein